MHWSAQRESYARFWELVMNDRWNETRNQAFSPTSQDAPVQPLYTSRGNVLNGLKQKVNEGILHLLFLFSLSKQNIRSSCFFFPSNLDPPSPYISETKKTCLPAQPIPERYPCAKNDVALFIHPP